MPSSKTNRTLEIIRPSDVRETIGPVGGEGKLAGRMDGWMDARTVSDNVHAVMAGASFIASDVLADEPSSSSSSLNLSALSHVA